VNAGATSVVATFNNASCCRALVVVEVAGTPSGDPLDGHTANLDVGAGTNPDALTSGAITTHYDGDVIVGTTSDSTGTDDQMIHAGTGESEDIEVDGTTGGGRNATASEWKIQPTPGSVSSTFTASIDGANGLSTQLAFHP
jgi:hypothetical protein